MKKLYQRAYPHIVSSARKLKQAHARLQEQGYKKTMAIGYQRSRQVSKSLFATYLEVLVQTFPGIAALVVVNFIFPHILTALFSIFVFGLLYINTDAVLNGDRPLSTHDAFSVVARKYFRAMALTFALIGICIFALVGPAVPIDILPNSWLSRLLAFGPLDALLLLSFISLFTITSVYLSYSLMFFWLENEGIVNSLEKSYRLVKGQWRRAAKYVLVSNILPILLFLVLPAIVLSMIASLCGTSLFNSRFCCTLLFVVTVGFVFPLQTILNVSFFQKLKMQNSP